CSLRASMPHAVYVRTAQSCAACMAGEPVRRGPIESSSTCASASTCEFCMASVQMLRRIGSSVAKVCALAAPAPGAAASTSAASRARLIADSVLSLVSMERRQSGQNRRGGKGWSVRNLPELHSPGSVHGELDEKVLAPARGCTGSYRLRAAGDRHAA